MILVGGTDTVKLSSTRPTSPAYTGSPLNIAEPSMPVVAETSYAPSPRGAPFCHTTWRTPVRADSLSDGTGAPVSSTTCTVNVPVAGNRPTGPIVRCGLLTGKLPTAPPSTSVSCAVTKPICDTDMMNVPAGTLPTANCPFMSVIAVSVFEPAMTVTAAPMSGASLVASSTTPATVPDGLPLSTLTPCEQPPTAASIAHTIQFVCFIDIPS